jgi:hypothetical protein|nr:MAG TPA: protein of unknown function (DUF4355) [Caudoviricetes sp.]
MTHQPRNVRAADEDAKPQPGATAVKQDAPAAQTEPDAKPQPGAKPANDAPAKPVADTPESKPTEEPARSESKPTEEPARSESKPTGESEPARTDADGAPASEGRPAGVPEPEDPRIADLQAKLAAATAQASAVVALANAGLPVSLAGLVSAGSPDDIERNVEALAQAIADAAAQKNAAAQPSLPPDADEPEEDMQARARRIFA